MTKNKHFFHLSIVVSNHVNSLDFICPQCGQFSLEQLFTEEIVPENTACCVGYSKEHLHCIWMYLSKYI